MKKKPKKKHILITFGLTLLILSYLSCNNISINKISDTHFEGIFSTSSLPKIQWEHRWGGRGIDWGFGIAMDGWGNAYVTGLTNSFGPIGYNLCLVKFNSSGVEWNRTWSGGDSDEGCGVALDSKGNLYIAGNTYDYEVGPADISLIKFKITGAVERYFTWGGSGTDIAHDIVLDTSDNAYIAGWTTSYGVSEPDVCLLKFNSSGVEWNYTWGGSGSDISRAIALDTLGNIYVAGDTESFGAGGDDICLVKFNTTGGVEWYSTWGGIDDDRSYGVVLDSTGNIYVTGYTESFGAGDDDICLVKFNTTGGLEWYSIWGGSKYDRAFGVVLDSYGKVYVAGDTGSFGAQGNICLLKFNSTGMEWNYTWWGSRNINGEGLAIDLLGNLYVTGDREYQDENYDDIVLLKFTFYISTDSTGISNPLFFIIIGIIIGVTAGGSGIVAIVIVGIVLPRRKRARVSRVT